jgi:hypothetical protein
MSTTIEPVKAKRVPKPVDPVKVTEELLKKALNLYFYAAIGDLQAASNEDPKFPIDQFQHYENLKRAPEEKIKRLKNICTIAPEIPQNLAALFASIKTEAASANGESYKVFVESTFMGSVIRLLSNSVMTEFVRNFEEKLANAPDQYSLIRANVLDTVSDCLCAMHAVTVIMNFMKVVAWRMACDVWYAKTPMSHSKFISCCAMLFVGQKAQDTIDTLSEEVRPKVKKAPKAVAAVVVVAASPSVEPVVAAVPIPEIDQKPEDENVLTI